MPRGADSDAGASGEPAPAIVVDERAGRIALQLRLSSAPPFAVGWRIDLETGESLEGACRAGTRGADGDGRAARVEMPLPHAASRVSPLTIRDQANGARLASSPLIVAPARCYSPPLLAGGARVWGLALQLYALRSARNWGIGDFTDLRTLSSVAARHRRRLRRRQSAARAVSFDDRTQASPYSPSSRARS